MTDTPLMARYRWRLGQTKWEWDGQHIEELLATIGALIAEKAALTETKEQFRRLYDAEFVRVEALEAEVERLRTHHDKLHTVCLYDYRS